MRSPMREVQWFHMETRTVPLHVLRRAVWSESAHDMTALKKLVQSDDGESLTWTGQLGEEGVRFLEDDQETIRFTRLDHEREAHTRFVARQEERRKKKKSEGSSRA